MDYIKYFVPWMVHKWHMYKFQKLAAKSKLKLKAQSLPQFIEYRKQLEQFMKELDHIITKEVQ